MEGLKNMYGGENGNIFVMKKRVMVIVDQSSHSKHAMMWALTHVTNKGDILTLLHIVPSSSSSSNFLPPHLAHSAKPLSLRCSQVEVEALVIQGPKMGTVMSQVKKLEVSFFFFGQIFCPSMLE
ncbi:hypothetical protein PHJA_003005700 [Phtheirospermum japonicum]|uniref:UspA domain-containing protein n=1 Tax=Phtheirospermum japonicum TaxID=374723 RepID=A0A830D9X7_9LAMI|nr:hypothetical protein PHJA_003005700 [Phtheirospermum japonicum]